MKTEAHIPENYQGYRGLPPLVGMLSMPDAIQKGLTVDQSVERMKYHHWSLKRLYQIFNARITAMPVYELKMAFSLHAHYCIEHVGGIFDRVREMRHPPYGLDKAPHEALDVFYDEILSAPTTEALVLGLYEKAVPAVVAGVKQQIADTNRLHEHPSYRVLRHLLIELEDVETYGREAVNCLVSAEARESLGEWLQFLDTCIATCGGADGVGEKQKVTLERQFSKTPYVYDGTPQRDERFKDSYNMGVHAESFLFDEALPIQPKTLMLYFKRMREIDVPEMMASIIAETPDKPLGYYRDMTRQLWDEARHAMMGEVGFASLNIDWTEIPFNFTWSLELNRELSPHERHAVLFNIEQGLMPKATGKQKEWEIAVASENRLSQLIQDYDWADEILHARVGRDWFVKDFGSQPEALDFGSECWSRVLAKVPTYETDGLTEHRNWWPEIYQQACVHWQVEPDERVLKYRQNYSEVRADMKAVSVDD